MKTPPILWNIAIKLHKNITLKYVEKGKSMHYNEFCNCGNFWKREKEGQTYEHQN
jgi:hypothetical protein